MNNRNKYQIEVAKAFLNGSRVGYAEVDGDVCITCDGYTAFFFSRRELVLDLEKMNQVEGIKALGINENDRKVHITGIQKNTPAKSVLELEFDDTGEKMYIDKKFANLISNWECTLLAFDSLHRLLVQENGNNIAAIMPCSGNY